MQAPLDVTVLRSGVPDTLPGRALNVCERGIAAVLAGEVMPGESVGVEVRLSTTTEPLRTKATVRYQNKLRCGLEFVAISPEQRSTIREWAKERKAEITRRSRPGGGPRDGRGTDFRREPSFSGPGGPPPHSPKKKVHPRTWIIAGILAVLVAGGFWWKWNRSWEQLESGLKTSESVAEKPEAQVPAEVMQKLLVHRVQPVYPDEARKQNLQGVIALDIVVSRTGSVLSMRALNGPDVLSRAAMDALRWWKFAPYRLNGEPAVVETTVAVEFKK
jgi:TonB family protein